MRVIILFFPFRSFFFILKSLFLAFSSQIWFTFSLKNRKLDESDHLILSPQNIEGHIQQVWPARVGFLNSSVLSALLFLFILVGFCERELIMANNGKVEKETGNKKRKRKEVAIFGNYRNYYGYRIGGEVKEDPRLRVFKREWFEGKECLDIGCNQGLLTISIAKAFSCQSIVGVDIDSRLVENAHWNLRRISKRESTSNQSSSVSESESLNRVNTFDDHDLIVSSSLQQEAVSNKLLDIVSFRKENFVKRLYPRSEIYDTILCLSVTKWIHLNWGDEGLITLFANIWRLLRMGGILLLEPQPWKSYQSNYQVSETATSNYHSIQFHPHLFQEILLDKIGFRTIENIADKLPGSVTGFNRPIFAFRK